MTGPRGWTVAAAAAVAALGVAPAAALAASLRVEDGILVYQAAAGEANDVEIFPDPQVRGLMHVNERNASVAAADGCLPTVRSDQLPYPYVGYSCVGANGGLRIDLGDMPDQAAAFAGVDAGASVIGGSGDDRIWLGDGDDVARGGDGDDALFGGGGSDRLFGEEGRDELNGEYGVVRTPEGAAESSAAAGDDLLDGGAGADILVGNRGADAMVGGAGSDTADYSGRREGVLISINRAADDGAPEEHDALADDIETFRSGAGDDVVTGGAGSETFATGAGNDRVEPGPGNDVVDAGPGADVIRLQDETVDRAGCGDGADTAHVDGGDVVGTDCERRAGTAAAPRPVRPLRLELKGAWARRTPRIWGQLVLASGSTRSVCAGLRIRIRASSGAWRRSTTTALDTRCRFALMLAAPRAALTVRARFAGSRALGRASSRRLRIPKPNRERPRSAAA